MDTERKCPTCNTLYISSNARQLYCTPGCRPTRSGGNTQRTRTRTTNDLTFIGIDGEGVDRPDGKHEYVMLSVGSDTLWRDGNALSLQDILSFLWDCFCQNPNAAYIGFFLGYDFIQWEKQLPLAQAELLLTNAGIARRKSARLSRANPYPDPVVWNGWELDIMAGRRFKLRPHRHVRSQWTDLCRNRTCQAALDDSDAYRDSCPDYLVPGEMDFVIPEGDYLSEQHTGSHRDYWKEYIRPHTVGPRKVKQNGWMYICDTGPFWQTSFLNVINPQRWDIPICTTDEYNLIVRGKGDRGSVYDYGDGSYLDDMRMYNVLENEILARITQRLNEGFMNEHIPIKLSRNEWYGPGRAAQLWMDMLHARIANPSAQYANRHSRGSEGDGAVRVSSGGRNDAQPLGGRVNGGGILNADVYQSMPAWFYDAAKSSYYGGWFEQMCHGHVGNVWEYDINSAYPFIISTLPCLHTEGSHTGTYERAHGNNVPTNEGRYTLVRASIHGSNPYIGSMPHRTRQGSILRPHVTKGWYWLHEIEAAQRALLIDRVDVEEWVSYMPCKCSPPFDPDDIGIRRMYQLRLDVGKNTPQGISSKLVYNSAYGKTAQSIGTPKYANPVYASLITAGCRTLILDAIATHPLGASSVSMVATDGVYFTARHSHLPLSPTALGQWDETFKPGMTQLMPGVYWDDKAREAITRLESPKIKSRGISTGDLAKQINRLDYLFAEAHQSLQDGFGYDWPTMELQVKFQMDSAKLALQRGKWETAGRVQHGAPRIISSNPSSKRNANAYRDEETGVTRTRPYAQGLEMDTTPYHKSFGYLTGEDDGLMVDRDGSDPLTYWKDLLQS